MKLERNAAPHSLAERGPVRAPTCVSLYSLACAVFLASRSVFRSGTAREPALGEHKGWLTSKNLRPIKQ